MSEERGVIRAVSWRDVFPGVILFRTFGISAGLWTLLLATVAAIAMTAGWRVSESIFLGDIFNGEETAAADPGESAGSARPTPRFAGRVYERAERERARQKLKEELRDNENLADTALMTRRYPGDRPGPIRGGGTIWQDVPKTPLGIWGTLISGAEPFLTTWANLGRPFVALADRGTTWTQWLYLLCGCLWTLVVWAFFGGAISRMAAVQLAREQRLGFGDAIGHARKKFTGYLAAPLFPIIGIGLTMIPLMIGGLLLMADALTPVAAVLAVLGFLFGLVIVILLLGLIFGWPLMWGTISAEGSDSFDALSRSFAYTFVRPLQYLGYVVIVMMFGALAWLLFDAAATVVVEASYYGTSLTADFATGDGEEVSRTQVVRGEHGR